MVFCSSRTVASRALGLLGGLIVIASGCKKPGAVAQELTQAPTMESVTGEAKCGVRSSSAKPLVIEWPAAERAALEGRASRGLVPVRYEGCEMEVLTSCTAGGAYEYVGLTQKREGVKITNADELYAQLPVGAAGLEAKLERAGQLNVDMVIVGRREADRHTFDERDLEGRCDQATHVITGLTVGAFTFYSGASASIGGGVSVGKVGVGTSSSSDQEILKSDGNGEYCSMASRSDDVPPEGCAALLRVEVVPIDRIFGGGPSTASSGGSSISGGGVGSGVGTGGVRSGRVGSDDNAAATPELDKKIRSAQIVSTVGYLGVLTGAGILAAGARVFTTNTSELEAEVGRDEVSPDRQSNLAAARTGQILIYSGLGVSVATLGLGVFGLVRVKQLRRRKAMAAAPLVGPGMTGVAVRGRF